MYVRADVTDDAAVRAAVEEAVCALGGLDVLVNNAGIGAQGGIEANDDAEWHRVLDVNVLGLVRVTRAALRPCGDHRRPRSSTPARSPRPQGCRIVRSTRRARARCCH